MTTRERFEAKVLKGECWIWSASRVRGTGYGQFRWRGTMRLAHRVAYELYVGPIPEGLVVHHRCRNRACVNPAHLEAISRVEHRLLHVADRVPPTHCKRGHLYDEANTYSGPDGARRCRACYRAYDRERARRARRDSSLADMDGPHSGTADRGVASSGLGPAFHLLPGRSERPFRRPRR